MFAGGKFTTDKLFPSPFFMVFFVITHILLILLLLTLFTHKVKL